MLKDPRHITGCLLTLLLVISGFIVQAQDDDTAKKNTIDSLLLRQKGVLGTLAQILIADTANENGHDLLRADLPFQKYSNLIIRNIVIDPLPFGVLIGDTTKRFNNGLTHLANWVHNDTRRWALRNHLFFKENELLSPFLMGNNERYLRDLPFLQEARFKVKRVPGTKDSVDVIVYTKDVLSIGGSIDIDNSTSGSISLQDDNFMGWGDRIEIQTLYDKSRNEKFGFGAEYVKRNILGSFIDASAGYINFHPSFNTGRTEEKLRYVRFIKPLVNPYMKWTYALSAQVHSTDNMFNIDSVYQTNLQYKFRTWDAWAGYNLSSKNIGSANEFERLRFLVSARIMDQKFLRKPMDYRNGYFYPYSDLKAILGSLSVFRLNFYKTQYIYGFGRKEDIPEGIEATFTTGWTRRESRDRPYAALSFEKYYLTRKEGYMKYYFTLGTSIYNKKFEDVNLLGSIDYFSRLHRMGTRWKQRSFFNFSYGRQFNHLMEEPFIMESQYAIDNFKNNFLGGTMRATVRGESVFFSPWTLLYFKFAPFVFGSATVFQFPTEIKTTNTRLYSAFGGGVRTRNESLIFGTIELRGSYFPKEDAFGNRFVLQLNTNLRFKYSQQFIRRPDFVRIN